MRSRTSPLAESQIRDLRNYYQITFGTQRGLQIYAEVKSTIRLIADFPGLGHVEPSLTDYPQCFRTFVQHANLKILYWVEDHIVKIALIFDTRQSPDKLRYIIEHHSSWVCEDVAVPYEKKKTSSRK